MKRGLVICCVLLFSISFISAFSWSDLLPSGITGKVVSSSVDEDCVNICLDEKCGNYKRALIKKICENRNRDDCGKGCVVGEESKTAPKSDVGSASLGSSDKSNSNPDSSLNTETSKETEKEENNLGDLETQESFEEEIIPKQEEPKVISPAINKKINNFNLNQNKDIFPYSSLVDYSYLLDAPAGKHGFVEVQGENLYFQDGTNARFFGLNVMGDSAFRNKSIVDKKVEILSKAGVNIVRFHCLDWRDHNFIINPDYPDSQHLNYDQWDEMDYFIAKLKEKGIYTHLVLLMDRQFMEADGLPNASQFQNIHGGNGYCMFDDRVIELQKKFAREYLNHMNPYTRIAYKDDPSIVLVELQNERNMFHEWAWEWQTSPEPYKSEFKEKWNNWLIQKYGNTNNLRNAWKYYDGTTELDGWESLEQKNVDLPWMKFGGWNSDYFEIFNTDLQLSLEDEYKISARRNDGAIFYSQIEREFFNEMKDFLINEIRINVPITTSGSQVPPSSYAQHGLDFIDTHYYADKQGKTELTGDPHNEQDNGVMGWAASCFLKNKPNGLGETGIPTEFLPQKERSPIVLEVTAYSLLQDLDKVEFFAITDVYRDNPEQLKSIVFGDIVEDPLQWGLFGIAAKMFHEKDVKEAEKSIDVAYSHNDLFYYWWYPVDIYKLAYVSKIRTVFFDENYKSDNDVDFTIAAGRVSGASYTGNKNFIYSLNPYNDLSNQEYGWNTDDNSGYDVEIVEFDCKRCTFEFAFDGIIFDKGTVKEIEVEEPYSLIDIERRGFIPIGKNEQYGIAFGFYDPNKQNYVFNHMQFDFDDEWYWNPDDFEQDNQKLRLVLDVLGKSNRRNILSHKLIDDNYFISDTGELKRDLDKHLFTVDTDKTIVIGGEIQGKQKVGLLELNSISPYGTIAITSLDGKNLVNSNSFDLKMVTDAKNTDQPPGLIPPPNDYRGTAPILTFGHETKTPTKISLGKKKLIDVYMENGLWELYKNGVQYQLYCDTDNIPFKIYDKKITGGTFYRYDGSHGDLQLIKGNNFVEFIYPENTKYVVLYSKTSFFSRTWSRMTGKVVDLFS